MASLLENKDLMGINAIDQQDMHDLIENVCEYREFWYETLYYMLMFDPRYRINNEDLYTLMTSSKWKLSFDDEYSDVL